jgi:hydrogenase large subunit
MRRKAQEMLAILGGKMPHNPAIVPGGVTEIPTVDKVASFLWRLNELREFIDNAYIPDVLAIAKVYSDYLEIGIGCGNLLSCGSYDLNGREADLTKRGRLFKQGVTSFDLGLEGLDPSNIAEQVRHSWYADSTSGRRPTEGETIPQVEKEGAYSWIKSPRYGGKVYEVGPLARLMATYAGGDPKVRELVDSALSELKATPTSLFSTLGRHIARALETKFIADAMPGWLLELKPGEPAYIEHTIPEEAWGMGLVEAARGALGHWIEIKQGRIANYQCVVPTTWNASPRDDNGKPGPIEQAISGVKIKDEANPFEIVRIVRSFDPCLACAVHLISPKGRKLGEFYVS